jgi:tetratricopeptide (TPR) repeat protein
MNVIRKLRIPGMAALWSVFILSFGMAQDPGEMAAFQEAERYYAAGMAQPDRYEKGRYMSHVIGLYVRYLDRYAGSRNEVTARFHLGYAYQSLGQIELARETYHFLITRHRRGPYVGSAARQMAYLAFVEERWEEAGTYFGLAAENLADPNLRFIARTKVVECLL